MHSLGEWKKMFLGKRQLPAPDGRPLYAYRLTEEEYSELTAILRTTCAFKNICDAAKQVFFPDLFVLYAAEWWRLYYSGEGFSWEPIFASVDMFNANYSSNVSERNRCVSIGLKAWDIDLIEQEGMRYIGSIAVQGGLPVKLLSEARGKIGEILYDVLQQAVQASYNNKSTIINWVKSLENRLPQTYRRHEIIFLLADVIHTIIDLKKEVKLSDTEDAINQLNKAVHDWRKRFPFPVDDAAAQDLLSHLMQKSVEKIEREYYAATFHIERRLSKVNPGHWLLTSACALSKESAIEGASLFGSQQEIPSPIDMLMTAGGTEQLMPLRNLAGKPGIFRIANTNWSIDNSIDAAEEHVLRISCPKSGGYWCTTAPHGNALNNNLPWVFGYDVERVVFIGQRGGNFRAAKIIVAIPEEWDVLATQQSDLQEYGQLQQLRRKLFLLEGEGTIATSNGNFRIRTTCADAQDEQYLWKGNTLQGILDSQIFLGKPKLYKKNLVDGREQEIPEKYIFWRGSEKDFVSAYTKNGLLECVYRKNNEIIYQDKLNILPSSACMYLRPENASEGFVQLQHWGAVAAKILADDIEYNVKGNQEKLLVRCRAKGRYIPECVDADITLNESIKPIRVRFPFPVIGGRLFFQDKELPTKSLLCCRHLQGIRLLCSNGGSHRYIELEFFIGAKGFPPYEIPFQEDKLQTEIRLHDYKRIVDQLLLTSDNSDARVTLRCRIGGVISEWYIARHDAALAIEGERVLLSTLKKNSSEEIPSLEAMAIHLSAREESPVPLTPLRSEGVLIGGWSFTTQNRLPGPWLIYPANDGKTAFQPTLLTVTGEEIRGNKLEESISVVSPKEREKCLDALIQEMAVDFSMEEWKTVEWLAEHLGHLPLSTLDTWKAFSRSGGGMAALLLRHSPLKFDGFLSRFADELPFMWETVSCQQWQIAVQQLDKQCKSFSEKYSNEILKDYFVKRKNELCSHSPCLLWMFHFLFTDLLPAETHTIIEPIIQKVLQDNADKDWPTNFCETISTLRRDPSSANLLFEKYGYRDSVLNLPVAIALDVAKGTVEKYYERQTFLALRMHIGGPHCSDRQHRFLS